MPLRPISGSEALFLREKRPPFWVPLLGAWGRDAEAPPISE
ncbi:hypothetical protein CGLO_18452 [Colletotrichum gloeosporioides Cg-14]|uniref:Uncharacterized protein n=1 Tax=Colletotrichum gloeosporioides (strain Cg-14) TaxID=1237896 RepID=T0KUU0_COLGC|nr:hypothetical protein CGLO_18452 [Colletotrichum gloeosporioides Cg-14]